ncbi:MAG: substrate-binding domain-containing protein [Bacteroidota bacterium]
MSSTHSVSIGGVPEYFNLPIHLAIENGTFLEAGVDAHWQEVPEGTGAMVRALANDELDLAVVLTEGMVQSISKGNPAQIVHVYVQSPLLWGIHVPARSPFVALEDLVGKRFAISRYGSGSHLMAILWAQNQHWGEHLEALAFEVVNNLQGARSAMMNGVAEIFLWEKYTTQFLVDNGEFRRLGVFPTPWPCFVVAASGKALKEKPDDVVACLDVLTQATRDFNAREDRVEMIVSRFGLDRADVNDFLPQTHWTTEKTLPQGVIQQVSEALKKAGLLS